MSAGDWLSVAMFISFIVLIFTGFPVAWVLGGLAVVFTAIGIIAEIDFGWPVTMSWEYSALVVDRIWDVMNNWVLVALPMFILMGIMLEKSGPFLFFTPQRCPFESVPYRSRLQSPFSMATMPT